MLTPQRVSYPLNPHQPLPLPMKTPYLWWGLGFWKGKDISQDEDSSCSLLVLGQSSSVPLPFGRITNVKVLHDWSSQHILYAEVLPNTLGLTIIEGDQNPVNFIEMECARWMMLHSWITRAYMLWLLQAVAVALSHLPPPSSTLPSPMSSCRFCLNPEECLYSKWNSYGQIAVDSEWNFIILMDYHGIPIESTPLLQNSRSQVSMKILEVF